MNPTTTYRLTHRHSSIQASEILQQRLEETENRLDSVLQEVQFANKKTDIAEKRADRAERAFNELQQAYGQVEQDLHQKELMLENVQLSSCNVEKEVNRCEKLISNLSFKDSDQTKLIKILQREKTEAFERASRLQEQVQELRSCLRRETIRREMTSSGWNFKESVSNGFVQTAGPKIPLAAKRLTTNNHHEMDEDSAEDAIPAFRSS